MVMNEWQIQIIGNLQHGQKKQKVLDLCEAPRGALAHWIKIKDEKTENYQLVVPSTWNASPRDPKGQRSAYESCFNWHSSCRS